MRNQVLEFNSGSIDEIGIFRDQFEFFQANFAKAGTKVNKLRVSWSIEGEIAQLRNQGSK